MVRIIKKNLGKTLIGVATEMARPTPSEGWHDMARYAVPLYLLAGELKESIGAQLAEGPEVIVDLDIPAPIRELWLDLIHSGTFTGGAFNASRAKFFSGLGT